MRLGPSARPVTRVEATRTPAVSRGTFLRLFTPVLAAGLAGPAIRRVAPSLGGGTALAVDADTVAEIPASGLIFKDIIKVMRFDDPKASWFAKRLPPHRADPRPMHTRRR